jgi:hypothetical protein
MILNLRQHLRRWTTSTGISGPIHRNTHTDFGPTAEFFRVPHPAWNFIQFSGAVFSDVV